MHSNAAPLVFDQTLHLGLPTPLAGAYRKAFNSQSPKELHDNACLFGLSLLRFSAFLGLALFRELQPSLNAEEKVLLEKLDRPSEGDWLAWANRAVKRIREAKQRAGELAGAFDAFWQLRLDAARSEVPTTVETLLTHLEKKTVVRRHAEPPEFFLALVRYRNDTIGHGAGLSDEKNQAHGEAILRAASQLAGEMPLPTVWEMKYLAGTTLGPTSVQCQIIGLTGPQWLREPAVSYPRGYPAPLSEHVVLLAKETREHLDLHPMIVFHNERALVFNGLRGKSPTYLDYESGQKLAIDNLAADYQVWKASFGSSSPPAVDAGAADSGSASFASPLPELSTRRFRFDRLLGRGGMGEVWLAYDNTLKRQVAVKRVRQSLLGYEQIERRFLQEARDAARLNHPNIVPILSIESDDQGTFLVLENMEGGSLRRQLQQVPLQLPLALSYVRQMLQALEHANHHGLVHRDVKPENILFTRAGVPKLADFGLAWLIDQATEDGSNEPAETSEAIEPTDSDQPAKEPPGEQKRADEQEADEPARVGRVREGTRAYLAPEVRSAAALPSPQSDLYSLGVTFYEMLTARPPGTLDMKRVPSIVVPLLRKLTHPDPNLRYASAQIAAADSVELERALEIAGRTNEETAARIKRTAEQALQLLADGRTADAQAACERILAEEPDNAAAQTGLLLIQLTAGEMELAAKRYRALRAAGCDAPVFRRLDAWFESIAAPTILHRTLRPLPCSYRIDELRTGRQAKELIELAADTVNLGDCGELLIELCASRSGASWECHRCDPEQVELLFALPGVSIQADFRFEVKRGSWFSGPRLLDADLTLTISAERFEIYRLAKYLGGRLSGRYRRPAADWIRPESAARFGYDAQAARQEWNRFSAPLLSQVLASQRDSA